MNTYKQQRIKMVEEQIARRGIKDDGVLRAMLNVPRHLFVPESHRNIAYADTPVPLQLGQTVSQPFIVAYMTELLKIKPDDRILEIGTGSGYQTAVLAEFGASIYTVELISVIAKQAKQLLSSLNYKNIVCKEGNGYDGWIEYAPFDKIIVTAAPDKIPENLIMQLNDPGIMVIPAGTALQQIYVVTQKNGKLTEQKMISVSFVPLQYN